MTFDFEYFLTNMCNMSHPGDRAYNYANQLMLGVFDIDTSQYFQDEAVNLGIIFG